MKTTSLKVCLVSLVIFAVGTNSHAPRRSTSHSLNDRLDFEMNFLGHDHWPATTAYMFSGHSPMKICTGYVYTTNHGESYWFPQFSITNLTVRYNPDDPADFFVALPGNQIKRAYAASSPVKLDTAKSTTVDQEELIVNLLHMLRLMFPG